MKKMLQIAVAGMAFLASVTSQGQVAAEASKDIRIKPPKASPASTPEYDVRVKGGGSNNSPNSFWLEVESEFDTAPEWMDEVSFTYYVLLKAKKASDVGPGGRQYNLFRGEVSYVDIPKGRGWKSNMFLPASTFKRYGDVEKAGVQVKVKGVIVAEESTPASRTRWWEEHPVKGALLPRNQTPFINVNPDANPTVRPAAAAPAN